MPKYELKKIIINALKELGVKTDSVHLEHPVDFKMGDYSTNVAMVYAKQAGVNPRELAQKIVDKIESVDFVEKVEVAGAGFINFYLSKKFFFENVLYVLEAKDKYGSNENLKGQKVLIEHSSPNLFKEFHIGHMVNNSIGESVSRIIKSFGTDVTNISYPSDVGLGIAKVVWSIIEGDIRGPDGVVDYKKDLFSNLSINEKISILGKAYIYGNIVYKNDERTGNKRKNRIDEINKKIYDKSDDEINKIYEAGKKITLEYFEKVVARLGSKFDNYIFESEAAVVGKKLVEENIGKVFEESDGAVVFKGEEYGLHTRVFVNSSGLPIYEAKDLGLMKIKFDRYNPALSIFLTDHEQGEYMKVVLKAMELINSDWANKTKHLTHGRLRFPHGRLSSREGGVLTANDLLNQVKEVVLEKMDDNRGIENKEETAEKIAVGAIKYFILKTSAGKNIVFELDKALALDGNSGPYLQYTYARALSAVNKAKEENIAEWKIENQPKSEISNLEKMIYKFPEVVERAGEDYEPHHIATYLFELAQAFNAYYTENKIVDKNNENSPYKVALTKAVAQVIKNGLYLLGIEAPEKI